MPDHYSLAIEIEALRWILARLRGECDGTEADAPLTNADLATLIPRVVREATMAIRVETELASQRGESGPTLLSRIRELVDAEERATAINEEERPHD